MELQDEILNAALSLFNHCGYRQVTVDDIAHKRGISKRTLYQHFDSKEEIARRVIERELSTLGAVIDAISDDDTLEFIPLFSKILESVQKTVGAFGMIFLEDIERHAPSVFQLILDFRARRIEFLQNLFARYQRAGLIRKEINPEWAAKFLILVANEFESPEFLQAAGIPLHQSIDLVREVFLFGIADTQMLERKN